MIGKVKISEKEVKKKIRFKRWYLKKKVKEWYWRRFNPVKWVKMRNAHKELLEKLDNFLAHGSETKPANLEKEFRRREYERGN